MTQQRRGIWQAVTDLPRRTPLRVKLITALLALVAIALAVISVAGIVILKDSLLGPSDNELASNMTPVIRGYIVPYLQNPVTRSDYQGVAVDWIPARGTVHQVIRPYSDLPGPHVALPSGRGLSERPLSPPAVQSNSAWVVAHLNTPFTLAAKSGGGSWRVLMQTVQLSNGSTGTVVFALDVSSVYSTIGTLTVIDLLISLAIICLLGVIGVTVVRRSLRPLTDIEKTAGAIAAGDLSQRVPERDPRTEVGRLGRSLNTMLSQIESGFRAQSRSEAAARRSEERMRQFVADASHELRTPLTAIRGFAEYYRQRGGIGAAGGAAQISGAEPASGQVAEGGVPESGTAEPAMEGQVVQRGTGRDPSNLTPADMDRIMRRVEQEAARMGVLVEDMLLLARLDQQRPLEARPVDLLALAADAVHDARVVAPGRTINLTVGAGSALLVVGDEVRLRQVIGNLMSNALTHTPDGTAIEVLIRSGNLSEAAAATAMARPSAGQPTAQALTGDDDTRREDAAQAITAATDDAAFDASQPPPPPPPPGATAVRSGPAAVLEVRDDGPGLTREQAEHVFERFYRADQARTTGGTGLGLAIVAALVAAHGGATWVRSEPGHGATFSIALPLSPDAVPGSDDDFDSDAEDLSDQDSSDASGNGYGPEPGRSEPSSAALGPAAPEQPRQRAAADR